MLPARGVRVLCMRHSRVTVRSAPRASKNNFIYMQHAHTATPHSHSHQVPYGVLYSQGNSTHPGRSGDRKNSDVTGDQCMVSAIATLKQARKMHMPLEVGEVAKNVRAYMRHAKLLYDKVVVILFWGRRRYTSLLKPYLMRELAVCILSTLRRACCSMLPPRTVLSTGCSAEYCYSVSHACFFSSVHRVHR